MTSTAGPGVDPMTGQGLTNKPQLQSRSPFISSLRESDLKQQRSTQRANSAGRQRQIIPPGVFFYVCMAKCLLPPPASHSIMPCFYYRNSQSLAKLPPVVPQEITLWKIILFWKEFSQIPFHPFFKYNAPFDRQQSSSFQCLCSSPCLACCQMC